MAIINNRSYDGGTIEVSVAGIGTFVGVESISFGMTKEVNKQKGSGNQFRGRAPGIISADDSTMEVWLSEFNNWVSKAGSIGAFMTSGFDVSITYRNGDEPLVTVKLKNCTPIKFSATHATGADVLVVPIDFSVMDIDIGNAGGIANILSNPAGAASAAVGGLIKSLF